jgi:hypothetical protein
VVTEAKGRDLVARHRLAAVAALALITLVASCTTREQSARPSEATAAKKTINCAERPYRNAIRDALSVNLEISAYAGVCVVKGTVRGNVTVRNTDSRCATASQYVALSLEGGTISGDVYASGRRCVMVWLLDGAVVDGDIVYRAAGNLGFLGDHEGARIGGDVFLQNGQLWATGAATTNRVEGKLTCTGGHVAGLASLATQTNWDGAGRDEKDSTVDVDGRTGAGYVPCRGTR